MTLLEPGDEIVASSHLYGGTVSQLTHTFKKLSIKVHFVDPTGIDHWAAAITSKTRALYGEMIGNPSGSILDLEPLADLAHSHQIPLLVDSTFATPYLCRPIELGADIVLHSATKWLGGHGLALGGLLVDGGRFDWEKSGKFDTLSEPYAGYHGIDFAEEFGPQAFSMRARAEGLRDFGATMAPQNAFYILQGVETLPLRMDRHMANTEKVLEFLQGNEAVSGVLQPSLPGHPDHELGKRILPKGAGSIISFGVKGGRAAGAKFIEACRLASHLANVGDAKTLVIHPGSTTHQQMTAEQLAVAGVGEDMIRLSVGLEDAGDIVDDLRSALKASQRS